MKICGMNKTTLLDYPKHLAATIFLSGCNFRCPFCHNSSLIENTTSLPCIEEDEVLDFLYKRANILEGVCITGGEPTIHETLPLFIEKIKKTGLKVKLDTNGSNFSMLQYLVETALIDSVAMDIKNSKEKYGITSGLDNLSTKNIFLSAEYLINSSISYEFRTTVVKEFHSSDDFQKIGEWLNGARNYCLQSYVDSGDILENGLHPYNKDKLEQFKAILTPYFMKVSLRGIS